MLISFPQNCQDPLLKDARSNSCRCQNDLWYESRVDVACHSSKGPIPVATVDDRPEKILFHHRYRNVLDPVPIEVAYGWIPRSQIDTGW